MDQIEELNYNVDKVVEKFLSMEDEIKDLREELTLEKESKDALMKVVTDKENLLKQQSSDNENKLEQSLLDLEKCDSNVKEYRERIRKGLVSKYNLMQKEVTDLKKRQEHRRDNLGIRSDMSMVGNDNHKIKQRERQIIAIQKEIESFK